MNRLRKFSLKNIFIKVSAVLFFFTLTYQGAVLGTRGIFFGSPLTAAADTVPPVQRAPGVPYIIPDTVPSARPNVFISADSTNVPDTIPAISDSTRVVVDTFDLRLSKDTLSAPITYYAADSAVVMIASKKIFLYGKTKIEYEDVTLTAPTVQIDQETQLMTASNSLDSTGAVAEAVEFSQGEQKFVSDTIQYNLKTQKGLTRNTITNQGEMFVHGKYVKKMNDDVTYVKGGFFTTCNLDEPHFGFRANQIKVITKKLAVSGPAHPEFEGVPVPVYIPFGFYPLNSGQHSGLLPPQFTTNDQMGLGLEGLGYYQVLGDYWDAKLYGSIYSYGGWSANINPTYRKRYRYSGGVNFGLLKTKRNFKGDPDYTSNNAYTFTWNHSSDSRARPGTSFTANVNASSTTYNENVPNSPQLNFQNQMGSSITYSKTWVDKPYNLTVSANHTQNSVTRLVSVSLPDLGFTVSTIYPFQKKNAVGTRKWYEQLGVAYAGNFRNQVSFYDTAFKLRSLVDTLQWGAQHNIPITLSLPPILNGAIVVAPSVSYSQVWVGQSVERRWNNVLDTLETITNKGFFVDQQAAFGVSLNTALFGMYSFPKSKRVQAIRHTIRPTVGINYRPDLSKKYYYTTRVNRDGDSIRFGKLIGGSLYNGYAEGETGGISFQLDNILEMKVFNKDTASEEKSRKVRLIDGLGFSGGYNFLADSMKLSNINLYFRTNLLEKININASANLSPYKSDKFGRDIATYAWEGGGPFTPGRITSGSIAMSTSFKSKPKDEAKAKEKEQQMERELSDPVLAADKQRLLEYMNQNPSEFVDFNLPWQFSLSYSLNFTQQPKADFSGFEKVFYSSAQFNGSFSLTPKWNFSLNGYYDFKTSKLQTFTMSINREMHCWQMSINVSPLGIFRYFNFTISPKSGILQDLRINRTRSFYTGY